MNRREMARIYSNENFPMPAVESLRRLGHDVLTIFETGVGGQAIPDEEVLNFAILEQRILLTLNRKDFIRLHQKNPIHSGIIVCTFDSSFEALATRIHAAIEENKNELDGQLIRINRPPAIS